MQILTNHSFVFTNVHAFRSWFQVICCLDKVAGVIINPKKQISEPSLVKYAFLNLSEGSWSFTQGYIIAVKFSALIFQLYSTSTSTKAIKRAVTLVIPTTFRIITTCTRSEKKCSRFVFRILLLGPNKYGRHIFITATFLELS